MAGQGPMGRCYASFHFRHLRKTVHLYVQFYQSLSFNATVLALLSIQRGREW